MLGLKLLVLAPLQLGCAALLRLPASDCVALLLLAACPCATTAFVIASHYSRGADTHLVSWRLPPPCRLGLRGWRQDGVHIARRHVRSCVECV